MYRGITKNLNTNRYNSSFRKVVIHDNGVIFGSFRVSDKSLLNLLTLMSIVNKS